MNLKMDSLELKDEHLSLEFDAKRQDKDTIKCTAFDEKDKSLVNYHIDRQEAKELINHLKEQFGL